MFHDGATRIDRQAWRAAFGARVRFDEPLSRHTSFRIGGPADVWVEMEVPEDVQRIHTLATEGGLAVFVLGGGTNILVSDRGVRGVVIHLGRPFARTEWRANGAGCHVRAGAATPFKRVVTEAVARNLTGLEFAEGIPGTVGGSLLMNAGAFGGEIATVIESVEVADARGVARRLPRSDLRFGYRRFDLPAGLVVTHVEFLLQPGDHARIVAYRDACKHRREARQPTGFPNAGSVFKNPPGEVAGRLIEAAGLKGRRRGGAMISERHANFILNLGDATAADVRALMDETTAAVWALHRVRLEPEIKLVGDWEVG
jgi:UDP-N-acetylmuramate dehydrogenase